MLRLAGAPPVLLGYCMGGLLALALATRRPDAVAGLALMATPFDFHAPDPLPPRRLAQAMAPLLPWLPLWGGLPVDLIQSLFALVDPRDSTAKFSRFADLDPDSAKARAFVLLEDWLNDGVPLAPAVAAECLAGWYGGNDPAEGRWRIAGRPVRPADWTGPSLAMVPARDRIVPPESALALAQALPACEILKPALGHIGMIVSGAAPDTAWAPLRAWLNRL